MLRKGYLDTSRTRRRAAVADRLKALAEDYERRSEQAAPVDAAKALARSTARECEALS